MKKLNWIWGGLAAIAFTACTNDALTEIAPQLQPGAGGKVSVTAYTPGDGASSRIAFADDGENKVSLQWETTESFTVIRGSENQTFSKETEGNVFTGTLPDAEGSGAYYAVYPANSTATDATQVPYDLSTQTGSLDSGKTYMYASSADGARFSFEHCTAILKATFSGLPTDATIRQVMVTTTNGKVKGTIHLADGTLAGGDYNCIIISYAEAVVASTPVYIYLPPMAADEKELSFEVTTGDGKYYTATLAGTGEKAIEAGKLYSADIEEWTEIPYLTFRSAEGQSLTILDNDSFLTANGSDGEARVFEYSLNGGEWTAITATTTIIFAGENSNIRLRGISIDGMAVSVLTNLRFSFGNRNDLVYCSGDIRTLMDYNNHASVPTGNARFMLLFADNCSALATAPALPAETLASNCYDSMFRRCISLTVAPELPATKLAKWCYGFMFSECSSLTAAPALPATTLEEACYAQMFEGCYSLTETPVLPAETLVAHCYIRMFLGCTKLNKVTMLATDVTANSCLVEWLRYVNPSGSGTFYKAASMNSLPSGDSGIPENWAVEDY